MPHAIVRKEVLFYNKLFKRNHNIIVIKRMSINTPTNSIIIAVCEEYVNAFILHQFLTLNLENYFHSIYRHNIERKITKQICRNRKMSDNVDIDFRFTNMSFEICT